MQKYILHRALSPIWHGLCGIEIYLAGAASTEYPAARTAVMLAVEYSEGHVALEALLSSYHPKKPGISIDRRWRASAHCDAARSITWFTALFDIHIAPPLCCRASRNESLGARRCFDRSKLNLVPACSSRSTRAAAASVALIHEGPPARSPSPPLRPLARARDGALSRSQECQGGATKCRMTDGDAQQTLGHPPRQPPRRRPGEETP